MSLQSTYDKCEEMHLRAMKNAFQVLIGDQKSRDMSLENFFAYIVDAEYQHRRRNSLKRLILNADLDQEEASIHDINYESGRKLNRDQIERLATCKYIEEKRNVFITGATGSGKTYLACALGMEACKKRFSVKYVRLPDLLNEMQFARDNNTSGAYNKILLKYKKPSLLILDEWLLLKPTDVQQHDILEIIHRRSRKSSTIFCSQYEQGGWYDQLGGKSSPLTESILDRITHDSYKINIVPIDPSNYRSMREIYGLDSENSL